MAQQTSKKYIKNNAIDETKIQLSNNGAIRAKNFAGADVDLIKLDASDKIVLPSAPIVSAEGSDASSLQTKNQVEVAVAAEASARSSADTTLQTNIDSEASARSSADTTLQTNIDSEASTRASADTTLQTNITNEASTRSAADISLQANIDAEEARAVAAEASLQSQITASNSSLMWKPSVQAITNDADLQAASEGDTLSSLLPFSDDESPEMVIGDFAAGNYILSNNGASSKLWKVYDDGGTLKLTLLGFDALAADHTFIVKNDLIDTPAGDENRSIWNYTGAGLIKLGDFDWSIASGIDLSGSFVSTTGAVTATDNVESAISKLVGNLAAEISRALAAEGVLQTNIDAEATARASADTTLQTNIDSEASARSSADTTLQTNIDAEATARASADTTLQTNIDAEATARASADTTLQTNITAEASARSSADAALQSEIDAEETRAQNAEAALDTRIDTLENAVANWNKLKIVLSATDITNGYVDLAHTVVPNSLVAFVARLALHQTEDYTLSIEGGVSRVTFAGSVVVGQPEGMEEGDNLFFTYQY